MAWARPERIKALAAWTHFVVLQCFSMLAGIERLRLLLTPTWRQLVLGGVRHRICYGEGGCR